MAQPFTIYKITVLYMLDEAVTPLTNTQFSDFFLFEDYTHYFNVQEVLSELLEAGLIFSRRIVHNTQYFLTPDGRDTLHELEDKLTEGIREDVRTFFREKEIELRESNSAISSYYRTTDFRYAAHCQLFSNNQPLLDLTLTLPDCAQAKAVCDNWQNNYSDVYAALLDRLVR